MKQPGYMDIVIAAARRAADAGEVPVAAAVVDADGNIVAVAENRMQRDAIAKAARSKISSANPFTVEQPFNFKPENTG